MQVAKESCPTGTACLNRRQYCDDVEVCERNGDAVLYKGATVHHHVCARPPFLVVVVEGVVAAAGKEESRGAVGGDGRCQVERVDDDDEEHPGGERYGGVVESYYCLTKSDSKTWKIEAWEQWEWFHSSFVQFLVPVSMLLGKQP